MFHLGGELLGVLGRALGIERAIRSENGGDDPPSGENEDPMALRDRLFSAVRVLVETASARQPLVFAVEDIHWADEGMLDLIEYLARWATGPTLLVCLARDELLDRRPGWGGGRLNATTVALEPLPAADARELVRLLKPIHAKVNLIPFNPWPGAPYECSSNNRIHRFAEIVNAGGLSAPVRTPRGRDILAACGQLKSESTRDRRTRVRDVEARAGL